MSQSCHRKCFSEEEALKSIENAIDRFMGKIMKRRVFHTFLNMKILKTILQSHIVSDINHRLSAYLKTIFVVVGWISLITGIIGIFSFLISLSGLGFLFNLGFDIGIYAVVYILLTFVFSLLSLFIGIGMIRCKKRVVSLMIFSFIISVLLFVISSIPVGGYSYHFYGNFLSSLFNLLVVCVFLILVIKNEHMFKY